MWVTGLQKAGLGREGDWGCRWGESCCGLTRQGSWEGEGDAQGKGMQRGGVVGPGRGEVVHD